MIAELKAYFEFYNVKRQHQSLDYQTPQEVYEGPTAGGIRTYARHDRSSKRECVRPKSARKNGEALRYDYRSNFIDWNGCLLRVVQRNECSFFDTNKYMGLEQLGDSADSVHRRIIWGMASSSYSFSSRRHFASRRESRRLSRERNCSAPIQMDIVGCRQ